MQKFLHKIKTHFKKQAQIIHDHEDFDMPIYEWIAPEYHKHERGLIWLIGIVSFFIFMVWYSIKTSSVTMAIASISLAAVYYITHKEPAKKIHIKISKAGIKVGGHIYHFSQIKSFWIIYHPPFVKTLNFRVYKGHERNKSIQLENADQELVRKILLDYLPEWEGKEESLTEIFARAFKL